MFAKFISDNDVFFESILIGIALIIPFPFNLRMNNEHKLLILTVEIIEVGFVRDFIVIGIIKINKISMINKKIKDPSI